MQNTDLVVVAIPSENDYVWNVSSEKVPHMTLLYLGQHTVEDSMVSHITQYVEHASSMLYRFGMDVDRRGTLGPKNADVLFFNKRYDYDKLIQFRHNLLVDPDISAFYNATEQFPDWTPHLTMGYPETPAKKDPRDYPGFSWVNFDRIALWTSNFDGPTFQLADRWATLDDMEARMAQSEPGAAAAAAVLEHYGVKGMKWGKRKASSGPASEDHQRAASARQKVKSGGTKSLSNKELQDLVTRMNLEKQFKQLSPPSKKAKAGKFVADVLINVGKQQTTRVINDVATQQIAAALGKK